MVWQTQMLGSLFVFRSSDDHNILSIFSLFTTLFIHIGYFSFDSRFNEFVSFLCAQTLSVLLITKLRIIIF